MAYRMIAIDLDGTLLTPGGTVSPRAKAAVHKALAAGLLVCFATGRNFTESRMVLDAVEHYDTAVFVGGAMVIDTRHRKTLHRMGMQPQLAREVCELFESLGHAALALQDTAAAGVDYLATADVKLDEATSQWMEVTAAKVQRVPKLAHPTHKHTIRVAIVAPDAEIGRVRKMMLEKVAQWVVCQSLLVPS